MLSTVEINDHQRVASIENEIYSKGFCYAAEDVARREVLALPAIRLPLLMGRSKENLTMLGTERAGV